MSDVTADDIDGQPTVPAPVRRRFSGKKLVLLVILPLLLLAGGAGAAWHFGLLDAVLGASEAPQDKPKQAVFYDLPEMLVNLSTAGKQASYLKLRVSLELEDSQSVARLEQLMPRVIDNFQVYLRELRMDELNGSAGLYRLKEELLIRVNKAVHPARVNDVLFKEMLVQ